MRQRWQYTFLQIVVLLAVIGLIGFMTWATFFVL